MPQKTADETPNFIEAMRHYVTNGWSLLALHTILAGRRCSCGNKHCKSPGKHPRQLKGVHAATRQIDDLYRMFRPGQPLNIGIATGAVSKLVVLDVDPRHGGTESLRALEASHGALPKTVLVLTGGNGYHYYLRAPGIPIRNSAGLLGPGLDMRGEAGYVVAPPSKHGSGNRYTWLPGHSPLQEELCEVPPWLLELLSGASRGPRSAQAIFGNTIAEGARNASLTSIAGKLRRSGLDEQSLLANLFQQNEARCSPPLQYEEVCAIAASVARYPAGPKPMPRFGASSSGPRNQVPPTENTPRIREQRADPRSSIFVLQDPPAWAEEVDVAQLLQRIIAVLKRHLAVPRQALVTMSLWVLFTYAHDAFTTSPLLALVSPDKRCGKTTALSLLLHLVRRPLPASNITPAALFRAIDRWNPTLLVDEADTFMEGKEELRGIINSGHQRDFAYVVRSVGESHDPRAFTTWGPKALAKIGKLPATLADRSVIIEMRRKKATEVTEPFDRCMIPHLDELRQQAMRWSTDSFETLQISSPQLPTGIGDRAKDNWRPLLAIADQAGGTWPQAARESATQLSHMLSDEDVEGPGALLLQDIRDVFRQDAVTRVTSQKLARALGKLEHRPWPEWLGRNTITPRQIAQLLRPFGIAPKSIRVAGEGTPKGYEHGQFEDAFERYLTDPAATQERAAGFTRNSEGVAIKPSGSVRHTFCRNVAVLRQAATAATSVQSNEGASL